VKTGQYGLAAACKECSKARTLQDQQRRRQEDPEGTKAKNNAKMERHRRKKGVAPKRYLTDAEKAVASRKYNDAYNARPGVWMKYLLTHAKIRNDARHPDTTFDLDITWITEQFTAQEGKCFWLKVPLRTSRNAGPWQVSLDRLDLKVGYTKTNTVLTSRAANLGRNSTSLEDFELFLNDLQAAMMRTT
jgi:hypothetical protein